MKSAVSFLLAAVVLLCIPARTPAEPPKAVEAVGHFGVLRHAGDESSLGSSPAWGGTVTLPFARRWAVDVDATAGHLDNYDSDGIGYENRRTLLTAHLQYRRGSEKVYGFVGIGTGLQWSEQEGRFRYQQYPTDPRTATYRDPENDFAPLGYKAGVVVNPKSRLLIRGEVFLQHAYALPNVMARIGIGWRF